jgi:hypothetical protein
MLGSTLASMPPRLLLAVLVVALAVPASANRRTVTLQCRASCGPAVQGCVDGGGRRGKCKRQTMKRCKREGISVCVPASMLTVATSGTDAPDCGTTDAPCRTIQFALDRVPVGGAASIKVAAGTYGDLGTCAIGTAPNQAVACVVNRQVTMLGGFTPPDWDTPANDPSLTVLDGGDQGRGVRIQRTGPSEPSASLEMDGFTIQHGRAQGQSTGDTSQTWCFGGGMLAEHSALTLRNLVFASNEAIGGSTSPEGGRGAGGGLAINADTWSKATSNASLQNITFDSNQALGGTGGTCGGYALGGGLFTFSVTVAGDGLVFQNNAVVAGSSNGAGVSGGEKSDGLGGAVAVEQGSDVDLQHVLATGNSATGGAAPNGEAGGAFGGGLFAELGTLTVSDAVVEQNLAKGGNGKNTSTSGSLAQSGGVHAVQASVTLERVRVVNNEARAGNGTINGGGAGGGGVSLTFGSGPNVNTPFTIRNSLIADNLVSLGSGAFVGGGAGGLWVQAIQGTVVQTTIADNRLGDSRLLGAGVTVLNIPGWQAHAAMSNVILGNHRSPAFDATSYANAALYVAQTASADVAHVLFAHNLHDSNAGISGGFNLPPGTVNITGALTAANAGFVSAGSPTDDYHLTAGSPAIDQAVGSAVPVDLDGNARPVGAAPDLGAYEYTP